MVFARLASATLAAHVLTVTGTSQKSKISPRHKRRLCKLLPPRLRHFCELEPEPTEQPPVPTPEPTPAPEPEPPVQAPAPPTPPAGALGAPHCKTTIPIPAPTPPGPAAAAGPKGSGYYGVPKDGVMVYTVIGNIWEAEHYNPQCFSSFCDKTVGTKMPDSCCNDDAWKDKDGNFPPSFFFTDKPDIRYHPDTKEEATCYPRVAPGPFNGGESGAGGEKTQWIRNYLGCEDGHLYGHENCVPGGTKYVTPEQFAAGKDTDLCDTEGECPWTYPMSRDVGITHFENLTGSECHCSTQSYFTGGPGCYIAFATLAQYVGMYPGVFVRIGGDCSGS